MTPSAPTPKILKAAAGTTTWLPFGILACAGLISAPLFGQTLKVLPVAGAPGETVVFEISWDAPPAATASSIEFEAVVPAQVIEEDSAGSVSARAAEGSEKTLTCAAHKSYLYSCLLAGGRLPVANGPVGQLQFKIKADARVGTSFFRIAHAEAVTRDLSKVMLNDTESEIVVNSHPTSHQDPSKAPRVSAAYILVERYLQRLNEARSTLDYEEARTLLARAQEALKSAQPLPAKPVAQVPPTKPKTAATVSPAPPAIPPLPAADTKTAAAYNQHGRELLNQRKFGEAVAELNEAIRLKPDLAQAWNARGFTYFMQKDYGNALKDLDEAIRLKPDYQNAYQNRSQVRKAVGDAKGGAEDQARAREMVH